VVGDEFVDAAHVEYFVESPLFAGNAYEMPSKKLVPPVKHVLYNRRNTEGKLGVVLEQAGARTNKRNLEGKSERRPLSNYFGSVFPRLANQVAFCAVLDMKPFRSRLPSWANL
jgi:hypothetical protein